MAIKRLLSVGRQVVNATPSGTLVAKPENGEPGV